MGYRASFTLVQLLEETKNMSSSQDVHAHIDAALKFTRSPSPSGHNYRSGRPLVDHLLSGAKAAEQAEEVNVAERLEDFAEYAAGDIPLTLVETIYIPEAREARDRMMQLFLEGGFDRAIEFLDTFLREQPGATGAEARAWLNQFKRRTNMMEVRSGRYGGIRLPRGTIDLLTWLGRVEIGISEVKMVNAPPRQEIEAMLRNLDDADLVIQAVQLKERGEKLDRLRAVISDPDSTEHDIHAELKGQTWIFGGRYVKELDRRRLTVDATLDIPLLRGDGTLHVVELKQANIPNLLEQPRMHPIVGAEVHRAVAQASHYLRSLDENRAIILAEFGINCRRAFSTVIIGHPSFIKGGYSIDDVSDAFRTYNSHLSRIEVITYQELVDSAARALTASV